MFIITVAVNSVSRSSGNIYLYLFTFVHIYSYFVRHPPPDRIGTVILDGIHG